MPKKTAPTFTAEEQTCIDAVTAEVLETVKKIEHIIQLLQDEKNQSFLVFHQIMQENRNLIGEAFFQSEVFIRIFPAHVQLAENAIKRRLQNSDIYEILDCFEESAIQNIRNPWMQQLKPITPHVTKNNDAFYRSVCTPFYEKKHPLKNLRNTLQCVLKNLKGFDFRPRI